MRLLRAALVLVVLAAAPEAHAGWTRVTWQGTPPTYVLRGVGAGKSGGVEYVWAAGGTGATNSLLVSWDDVSQSATNSSCASFTIGFNAIWVKPDATYVHAFGNPETALPYGTAHAWSTGVGQAFTCEKFSVASHPRITVRSAAFLASNDGWIVGKELSPTFLGNWVSSASVSVDISTPVTGEVFGVARTASGKYVLASGGDLILQNAGLIFAGTPAGSFSAISALGEVGVAVGNVGADTRLFDATAQTMTSPGVTNQKIAFSPVSGISVASLKFAVAVGASGSVGAIARSLDTAGTANFLDWWPMDMTGVASPKVLYGVTCWDENHCAAVGGDGATTSEFLIYVNQPPTATISINGIDGPQSVQLFDNASILLAYHNLLDPEGEDSVSFVNWNWNAGVDTSTSSPVTVTPTTNCSQQPLDYYLDATDGRAQSHQKVTLTIDHAPKPPSTPTLTPDPTSPVPTAGDTISLTASATADCGKPLTWQITGGGRLAGFSSTTNTTNWNTSSLLCTGGAASITVTAKDSDSLSTSNTYNFTIGGLVQQPVVTQQAPVDVLANTQSTVHIVATHCSGSTSADFGYAWGSCGGFTGSADSIVFDNQTPAACLSTFNCTVTVTPKLAGQPASAPMTFGVTLEPTAAAGTVTFTPSANPTVAPNGTVAVTPTPHNLCNPTRAWSCTPAPTPAPTTESSWNFTNLAQNCGASYSCTVTATATSPAKSGQGTVVATLDPWPSTTSVTATWNPVATSSPVPIGPGASNDPTVAALDACATIFHYTWTCDSGMTAPADDATTVHFHNPGGLCADKDVSCTVTATPTNAPASTAGSLALDVKYLADQTVPTTVAVNPPTAASLPGPGVAPGFSQTVDLTVHNNCAPSIDVLWSCSGPVTNPAPGATTATFTNPGGLCGPTPVHCMVTATPTPPSVLPGTSADVYLTFAADPSIPTVVSLTQPPASDLRPGDSTTGGFTAVNKCTSNFTWSHVCQGPDPGTMTNPTSDTASIALTNPGGFCADQQFACSVTATPSGNWLAGNAAMTVTFLPDPPANISLDPLVVDEIVEDKITKSRVTVHPHAVDAAGGCSFPKWVWNATLLSNPSSSVGNGIDELGDHDPSFVFTPTLCGNDIVQVDVTETGLQRTLSATAPIHDPGPVPTFDDHLVIPGEPFGCGAPEQIVVGASVHDLGCKKGLAYAWRQIAGPTVATKTLSDGKLELDVDPSTVGQLWGYTATFEVVVSNARGSSKPEVYSWRFPAPYFVHLDHHSNLRVATVGQPIPFTLKFWSDCAAAVEKTVDMHLTLAGLQFVSGSAKLDGVALADPQLVGDHLVFSNLTVPSGAANASQLTYTARRNATAAGLVTSKADAWLSPAPDREVARVSEDVSTGASRPGTAPEVSCECTSTGGGPMAVWFLSLLGLASATRRRRRRSC